MALNYSEYQNYSYSPTNWVNGTTKVNATNLNKMESGIKKSSDLVGNTNISSIGDGTLTGGLSSVNTSLSSTKDTADAAKSKADSNETKLKSVETAANTATSTANSKRGSSDFVAQRFVSASMTVAAGQNQEVNFNITKSGYKALAIRSVELFNTEGSGRNSSVCNPFNFVISSDTAARVMFHNFSSSQSAIVQCAITVIYVRY